VSIFDALPSPTERVNFALRRDLSSRVGRDFEAGRWNGYAYQGGADLLLRHGTFWPGRAVPDDYAHLRGGESQCFGNALDAAKADSRLRYCEGYHTTGQGMPILHAWCVDDEGVVELTIPTLADEWVRCKDYRTNLPFLPPERWGYWGVTFTVELAEEHLHTLSLPMLDRSNAEIMDVSDRRPPEEYTNVHDFPILKVPYDPNRRTLP
jgi:hypothetical protein